MAVIRSTVNYAAPMLVSGHAGSLFVGAMPVLLLIIIIITIFIMHCFPLLTL